MYLFRKKCKKTELLLQMFLKKKKKNDNKYHYINSNNCYSHFSKLRKMEMKRPVLSKSKKNVEKWVKCLK